MLLHNDFLNKKLYLTHKTRRKSIDSLKAFKASTTLTTATTTTTSNRYSKISLPILKHKLNLDFSYRKIKSLKLLTKKNLSNTLNNQQHYHQQQQLQQEQQQQHYHQQQQYLQQQEKRLSFINHETNNSSSSINNSTSNINSSNLNLKLFSYNNNTSSSIVIHTNKKSFQLSSTQNDLKQRLALRKRYLRRKRKRKFYHKRQLKQHQQQEQLQQQQQQFHNNNCYCQTSITLDQIKIDLLPKSTCKSLAAATSQQHYNDCYYFQTTFIAEASSTTSPTTIDKNIKLFSQISYQKRLSNNIIMLKIFILSILRLSLTSISTLYNTTATTLSLTTQHIVGAVIAATTLPIIKQQRQQQQQQHQPENEYIQQHPQQELLQQQQQHHCMLQQDMQHKQTSTIQQHQLHQHGQHQQQPLHLYQQEHHQQQMQQHCRRVLPLTTKGLNKYSWIFLLIYLNLSAKVCLAGYNEKRLLHDLLDTYNTLERPVLNESDPLQLSFGLTLMQIIDVDEKNQLLVTNVWLKLEWNDMNLRWNTSDYGGIKDLRIPPHRIWKPDVLMYNSADEGFDGTYQTNVVVRNNGSCLYVPPGIFKSTCKIDITWFPFDDQRCEMKFGSWTYDGFQLDLQLQDETGGDISSYVLNGEWELLGVPGKRNEIYYNCCPEPYIDITFAIVIRRRTLYYFFNLIIPCVLIASMALLGFALPPDSGEKLSLGVTILLSLTVFLNMVAETMPATSDAVPLLGAYFNCIMFMVASSVVSTILVLNYHHRNADTHEMSDWIRVVFLCWLPWILRMQRPGRPIILDFSSTPCSDTSSERKHQILSDVELKERSSKSLLANVLDIDDDFRNVRPLTPGGTLPHNPAFYRTVYGQGDDGSIGPIGSTRMPDAVTHHTCIKTQTEYELSLILKEIRYITDQLRKEDEENDIADDWKFAAMVVDRLCLIMFTMFAVLATMAVLLSAPHVVVS